MPRVFMNITACRNVRLNAALRRSLQAVTDFMREQGSRKDALRRAYARLFYLPCGVD